MGGVGVKTADKPAETRVSVHRVVLPEDGDPAVLPLYIDWRSVASATAGAEEEVVTIARRVHTSMDRRSIEVPAGERLSFATLLNAFPAAYWRRWTGVETVQLRLTIVGLARVDLFRSTVRGAFNLIESRLVEDSEATFEVSIKGFGDGGWLWFDIEPEDKPATLRDAEWRVEPGEGYRPKKVSVAITTFNRPDDCVSQMARFADAPELMDRLDQLMITDQGTKSVQDAEGYDEQAARLGHQFRLIHQGNLGGSGGFARGMYEGVQRATTDYVLLMDDDVLIEPEGILRAVNFADFTRRPTIVGGQMLNLFERSILNSFGENVDRYEFLWGPVVEDLGTIDFDARPMRSIAKIHKRVDVDYNGWWMCLIPREVIERVGLALPVFIKWDDAEYGLRAGAAGFTTVTLPGAAVWHEPWTEKEDLLGWQAYFHERNRYIAALLHSNYAHGGAITRVGLAADLIRLLSMQYSAQALRMKGLEDVLRGPAHMHQGLPTVNADVRAFRATYADAAVVSDFDDYPVVNRPKPLPRGKAPSKPKSLIQTGARVLSGILRNSRRPAARSSVDAHVTSVDAQWWRLYIEDSASVTTADGSAITVLRRSPAQFYGLLVKSIRLRSAVSRQWPRLAREYREALPDFTSTEAWIDTFRRSGGQV